MRALTSDVLDALDRSVCTGNALRLGGALDRKLYTAINKVIVAAGGKWNRKAGSHLFDGDARDAIEQIVLTGGVGPKQELGQFDTPAEVAARVIALADIAPGMSVLEPSAGIGNLAVYAKAAGGEVMCVELDFGRSSKLVEAGFCSAVTADFLTLKGLTKFDRVVMNPPFARQADIDHVIAAVACLKLGGILVAVMSAGIRFRSNPKTLRFRAFLDEHAGVIEDLPAGAFKAAGTAVNTCIVKLSRPL